MFNFKKLTNRGREELAAEEAEAESREEERLRIIEKRAFYLDKLTTDKAFQVFSLDGLYWICPYTVKSFKASLDAEEIALNHLITSDPEGHGQRPHPIRDMRRLQRLQMLQELAKNEPYRFIFDDLGMWLNPWTGAWDDSIRITNKKITGDTLKTMAIGLCVLPSKDLQHMKSQDMLEQKLRKRNQTIQTKRQEAQANTSSQPLQTFGNKNTPDNTSKKKKKALMPRREPVVSLSSDDFEAASEIESESAEKLDKKLAPDYLFGGYKIIKHLSDGGMGTIYLAMQLSLQRQVVLKILPRSYSHDLTFSRRFIREAQCSAAINNTHVVTVYDAGNEHGQLFLAMEYMENGDVLDLMSHNGGSLPHITTLQIVQDCAVGLAAMQEAQLVHRDIKPSNIFITKKSRAKIGDLGLVRSVTPQKLTEHDATIGTPAYMSPEQIQNNKELDIRSDIYSLGVTLYEVLTGKLPYKTTSTWALFNAIINDPIPDIRQTLPDIHPSLADIVTTCLQKNPEDRYLTPQDLMNACRMLLAEIAPNELS